MAFFVSIVEGHLDQRIPTVGIAALVGRPSAWARDADHSVVNKAEYAHASFWIINPTIRLLDDLLTHNLRELFEVLLPIAQVVADQIAELRANVLHAPVERSAECGPVSAKVYHHVAEARWKRELVQGEKQHLFRPEPAAILQLNDPVLPLI
ncbi:hypothetical protein B484DRAFT_453507 [Ochromonadaceae sp. CCMP2298]|nr:hypothetical protein B484DRAFT_453507 [Ochromonadaceae sp. CCMP2298]